MLREDGLFLSSCICVFLCVSERGDVTERFYILAFEVDNRAPDDVILRWREHGVHRNLTVNKFSLVNYQKMLRFVGKPEKVVIEAFDSVTDELVELNRKGNVTIMPSVMREERAIVIYPDGRFSCLDYF